MLFGNNLLYLRKRNSNMTQERLAEKLGVSRQTVSKWESGEAYPEIPKLLDLCDLFRCKLDDLLRQDLAASSNVYYPVRIEQVAGFRMAQYAVISANPEDDSLTVMQQWARKSGLTEASNYVPCRIGWNFPYVSNEQKTRFKLRGYVCAYILPEDFQPACDGPEILNQETANYAVMTIREPFAPEVNRVTQAYQLIMEYLRCNGIKKSAQTGILPCFERIYEKDGAVYMDVYVHCDSNTKTKINTSLL